VIVEAGGKKFESAKVKHVRGGPELPLQTDELWAKFEGCLQVSPRPFAARALFDALMNLDRIGHVREIPGLK